MAISAGDITILRYPFVRRTDTTLNIAPLVAQVTAEIDTFTATYPRGSYPVTNTSAGWADIGAGKLVRITDSVTGAIKFEGITRLGNDATNVYIAGHVDGDSGIALEEASDIVAGDDVTVYQNQIPQTFLSRLASDGTLYKRYDVEFNVSDPQTSRPRPQSNLGSDKQYRVSAGGTKTGIILDGSSSYSYISGTISYEWVLPAGVTITSGTTTSSSITVSMDEGIHRIRLRVTDSAITTNPSSQGNRYYYINSPDEPAFSDDYPVSNINNFILTREGWTAQFTVSGGQDGIPTTRLFTGASVLFSYNIEYSQDGLTWTQTTEEALNRRFYKGYIYTFDDIRYTPNGRIEQVTFTVKSLFFHMDRLPIASQVIVYDATPANWQESPYTDINRLMYTITRYHNDVMNEDNDITLYADNYNYITPLHSINHGSLSSAMRAVVQKRLGCNLGNLSDGTLYMYPHRSYEDSTFRSSQTSRFSFTTQDIFGDSFSYSLNEVMKYQQTNGSFFISGTTGTPVIGIRGLGAPMQGVSINQLPSFFAKTKTEGLERIGHDHQNKNRRFDSISLTLLNDGVVEPAKMDVFNFDLDTIDALDKDVLNNKMYIPIQARYVFNGNEPPIITVDFEPETEGKPATELNGGNAYLWDFTVSDGGFTGNFDGTWVTGEGWKNSASNGDLELYKSTASSTTTVLSVTVNVEFVTPSSDTLDSLGSGWLVNGIRTTDTGGNEIGTLTDTEMETRYSAFTVAFTTQSFVLTESDTGGGAGTENILVNFQVGASDVYYIRSIQIEYEGTNNFTGGTEI